MNARHGNAQSNQTHIMPLMKPRYLAFIPIFALLLAGWLGREQLVELTITSSMRGYGLKHVSAKIDHLGTSRSHITRLGFSLATDASIFRLEAEDISLYYNLEQLTQRKAESLIINRLAIYHQTAIDTSSGSEALAKALEPIAIIAALKRALNEYVIFNSVSVDELSLNGESFGLLQGKPLQLQATADDAVVTGKLSLMDKSTAGTWEIKRQLIVSRLSPRGLQAELGFPQTPDKTVAGVELNVADTHIEGGYFVNPRTLNDWLQPFIPENNIDNASKVTGTLAFDFADSERIVSVITARSGHVTLDKYRADNVQIKLKTSIPTRRPFLQIKLENGSHVKVRRLEHETFSLASTRMNMVGELSLSGDGWRFSGGASAPSITAQYQSRPLRLESIAARVATGDKELKIDGDFSTAKIPGRFSFALEHSLINESGKLAVKPLKPIDLSADNAKLSHLWVPWPYPFDLLNGSIKFETDASWSAKTDLALHARMKVENGGGYYGEIVFSGLSFDHRLEVLPELRSIKPSKITLSQLDSGVIASNLHTTILFTPATTGPLPRIEINDLYGEIFGGSFSGDEIVFDLNSDSSRFMIAAEDIDLAAIVATQQLEDLIVTGRIDGTIPVTISDQGVFIEHGVFINDVRAGTIRYIPAGGSEQLEKNPLTGIALDALRDFRYSHLAADVNFRPDGLLVVSLQLKGTSPELDTKRPVHLNISTEQNLLSLLKSLRYAESVGASIEQRVRNKYKKSSSEEQETQ